jgi:hypothetical protein
MAEKKTVNITIQNKGQGVRGFYDAKMHLIEVQPGEVVKATVTENTADLLRRGADARDATYTMDGKGAAADKPTPRATLDRPAAASDDDRKSK